MITTPLGTLGTLGTLGPNETGTMKNSHGQRGHFCRSVDLSMCLLRWRGRCQDLGGVIYLLERSPIYRARNVDGVEGKCKKIPPRSDEVCNNSVILSAEPVTQASWNLMSFLIRRIKCAFMLLKVYQRYLFSCRRQLIAWRGTSHSLVAWFCLPGDMRRGQSGRVNHKPE